jgi:hypothetical protein
MVNLWDAVVSHDAGTPDHWKKNRTKNLKKLEIKFPIIFRGLFCYYFFHISPFNPLILF